MEDPLVDADAIGPFWDRDLWDSVSLPALVHGERWIKDRAGSRLVDSCLYLFRDPGRQLDREGQWIQRPVAAGQAQIVDPFPSDPRFLLDHYSRCDMYVCAGVRGGRSGGHVRLFRDPSDRSDQVVGADFFVKERADSEEVVCEMVRIAGMERFYLDCGRLAQACQRGDVRRTSRRVARFRRSAC